MDERVKGFRELAAKSKIPERTLRTAWQKGIIPGEVIGHRTIFFNLRRVEEALQKREVRAKNGGRYGLDSL